MPLSGRTAAIVVALASSLCASELTGTPRAREATQLCNRAGDAPEAEKRALLAQSLSVAEQAVAENERDPVAHFAVFCAVGRQAQLDGSGVLTLFKVRRMRAAVDRALELAPDYPAALLGKGSLLLNLPWLLGGDKEEGERLIRRALAAEPDYVDARLTLARALAARGRRAEARDEANAAAQAADRANEAADAAEARRLAADLGP